VRVADVTPSRVLGDKDLRKLAAIEMGMWDVDKIGDPVPESIWAMWGLDKV